jgi:branched-chain amino acid transport system substrate-binding protein
VLSGDGITIPADQSVIGKEIRIDPATGDTTALDLTIEIVKDKKETFFKSQTLTPL